MNSHRLVDSDPVKAVQTLITRGLAPHTLLTLYTGTKHHANEIRRLLDDSGHKLVGLQFKGELMLNLPKNHPEPFAPMSTQLISAMFRPARELGRHAKRVIPPKNEYMIQFMHQGHEPVYAVNPTVTDFTRDITAARVGSHARAMQMSIHINRHCNFVTLPKFYTVDGDPFKVDDHYTNAEMYSTPGVWTNESGAKFYSEAEYLANQEAA